MGYAASSREQSVFLIDWEDKAHTKALLTSLHMVCRCTWTSEQVGIFHTEVLKLK